MEALSLNKALELYEILGEHIPDTEDDALDFIGKIVSGIRESGEHKRYVDAVMLMSGKEWEEIKELKSANVLELFISGLTANKIISLKTFCDSVGYGNA